MYLPYGPVCYSKGPLPHPEAGLFCLLFSVSPPCYSRHRLCYAGAAAPPPYIALRHHPASPISVPPPSRRPCSSVSVPFTGTTSCIPLSVSPSSCHVLPWPLSASPPLRISASAPLVRPPLRISLPRSSAVPPSSTSASAPPARPPLRISPRSSAVPPSSTSVSTPPARPPLRISLPRSSAVPPSNTSVCAPIGPPRRVSPRFLPLLILSVLLTSNITFYGFTFLVKYPTIQSQQQDT